ncbi:MAG: response regulator [Clostridiaceae bacterium]|nr:response regulator [Clostridiaceae bacterium]
MYKLILVDDEEEVRKGILKKIQWEQYGFQLIGEAENGREALEIAEKVTPDVVITDIKMPFMDGLQLSEVLKKRFPNIKIIILTGFDEFEYAHRAVNLNVIEYALKPVSSKDLIEILLKAKTQIDEELSKKADMDDLKEHYVKSLPILKEKFFTSLITSKMPKEEIQEKSINYNVCLDGKAFVVAVISMDQGDIYYSKKTEYAKTLELIKFAVFNIATEILSKYNMDNVFMYNDQVILISNYSEEDRIAISNKILPILEEIRQNIKRCLMLTVTIGLGTIFSDVSLISDSYENAMSALDYRLIIGNDRTIWIEDIEPSSKDKIVFDEIMEHDLSSAIKVGTEEEINDILDKMFDKLLAVKVPFKDYQIYLLEMLTTILKVAKNSNVDLVNVFGENYNLFVELYEFNDLNRVRKWFKDISLRIWTYIIADRQDTCKLLVQKAEDYISRYYSDSEITINKLCNYLHISPTYFSFIFKRETEMTFVNYLTQIRMDMSKELLRTTNMKSSAIAKYVGYSEPNYFSYCFKKYFGVSPSEYRNSL